MVCNSCIVTIVTKAMFIKAKGLGVLAMRIVTAIIAVGVSACGVIALHEPVANGRTSDGAVVHVAAGVVDMAVLERGIMSLARAIPLGWCGGIRLVLRFFPVYMKGLPMTLEAVIVLFSVRSHGVRQTQPTSLDVGTVSWYPGERLDRLV